MYEKLAVWRVFLRFCVSAAGWLTGRRGAGTQRFAIVSCSRAVRAGSPFLVICVAANAMGGGYQIVDPSGEPYKWSTATPVTFNYDLGPFSATVSNATADTFTSAAINAWGGGNIPTCALTFAKGADLVEDHGDGLGIDPNYNEANPDGISPVIYDQNGTLTAGLFSGAQFVVIGFASPKWTVGTTIIEGQAVLNGLFLDGAGSPADISQTQMQGVVTHEFGHMLNLAHAQCNDAFRLSSLPTYMPNYSGYPTMYPIVHPDIATPELDDKVWISNLYPSAAFASTTQISGFTRDVSSSLINGVNIVARSATVPTDVVTCVSGYTDGTPTTTPDGAYLIPGLPAGSRWVLDFEQIPAMYTGGSRVGPIDPPMVVGGPVEFINEAGIESTSDATTRSTTFVTPASGALSNINLTLNSPSTTVTVAEVDVGASFPTAAMALTVTPGRPLVVNGTMTTETGNVLVGGDSIEDWYVIAPPAGVEINRVTLKPNAGDDSDLYLMSYNQTSGTLQSAVASANAGNGVTETIEGWYDTTLFGTGTAARKVYIAVNHVSGGYGAYTLTIESSLADSDALVVDNITGGNINVSSGTMTITGRGFKNTGGNPLVTVTDPNITVNSVTGFSTTSLTVSITRQPGFTPGNTDVQVTNQAASGGYGGRRYSFPTVPVVMSLWEVE